MSEVQLHALCLRLLGDLDIRPPLTPRTLCQKLGGARGRRIQLSRVSGSAPVGHLITGGPCDLIAYTRGASRDQKRHVIFHEVMHLVLGHGAGAESLLCGALVAATAEGEEDGFYHHWEEREAEDGATILTRLARLRPRPALDERGANDVEVELAKTFGLRRGGRWR
jgi:hypothetical protein